MNTTYVQREESNFITLVTDYDYSRKVKVNNLFKCLRELAEQQGYDDNYNPLVK